uniref:DUF6737 domain-containing protein n=1 Tax=Ananas comosus var. bracteatus TaxID=296719 RepID=A0A6V7PP07_ANACO|nr:unnamed protein product [Ananas comosus var. bracteatus]
MEKKWARSLSSPSPLSLSPNPSPIPIESPPRSSIPLSPPSPSSTSAPPRSLFLVRGGGGGGGGGRRREGSEFLDEDGVVDDMDGYLNYLSLEYDSVWDTKPAWCQPWTILLTGVSIVGCSWILIHSILITSAVFVLICTWWYIFLHSYPKAYSDMIAERRRRVTNGIEDTYGSRKVED